MDCQYCQEEMTEHHQVGPVVAYVCPGCQALAERNAFTGQVTWTPGGGNPGGGPRGNPPGRFGGTPPKP